MFIENLRVVVRGSSPFSPGKGDVEIKIILIPHHLLDAQEPDLRLLVAEAQKKASEAEYGVRLTVDEARSIHTWLGEFLSAAHEKK